MKPGVAPPTPAGWHPDPTGQMTLRWWDGTKWTEQLAPIQQATAPGYHPLAVASQRTNGMAIASLVLSLVWLWGLGSLLAVIFGEVARSQLKQAGGTVNGAGMALAGRILGSIGLVLSVLFFIAAVLG